MTTEPDFGGDGVWPPKHDWVERVASYCVLRTLVHVPREYSDVPLTDASIMVFFPAADPGCPKVTVRGVRQARPEQIEVVINTPPVE